MPHPRNAITEFKDSDRYLVERVFCKHIGNRVHGTINGLWSVCFHSDGIESIDVVVGRYFFSGVVDDRVLLMSYSYKEIGWISSGTLALKADSLAVSLDGVWAGYEDVFVKSGCCSWGKGFLDASSGFQDRAGRTGDEVDHGDERRFEPVSPGSCPGRLEQPIEPLQAGVGVGRSPTSDYLITMFS